MVGQVDRELFRLSPKSAVMRLLTYAFIEGRPLTTRGRWVNPFVRAHLKAAATLGPSSPHIDLAYIVGSGRSGTTILGRLLSASPEVAFLNEPKLLWNIAIPREDIIGSYSSTTGTITLTPDDATAHVIERFERMYGYVAKLTGATLVVDKYPEVVFRAEFALRAFPTARFLVALRDGREVVQSIAEWSQIRSTAVTSWWGAHDRKWVAIWRELVAMEPSLAEWADTQDPLALDDLHRAALEWSFTTRQSLRLVNRHDVSALLVRHEELIEDPRMELERIMGYLKVQLTPAQLAYACGAVEPSMERPNLALEVGPVKDFFDETLSLAGYNSDSRLGRG